MHGESHQVFPVLPSARVGASALFRGKIQDVYRDLMVVFKLCRWSRHLSHLAVNRTPKQRAKDYLMGFFLVGAYKKNLR